jgi:hypothetical protein
MKKDRKNILSVLARPLLALAFLFGQTAWAGQNQNASDKQAPGAWADKLVADNGNFGGRDFEPHQAVIRI